MAINGIALHRNNLFNGLPVAQSLTGFLRGFFMPKIIKESPIKRLIRKIERDDVTLCWNFTGCISPQGYGQFWNGEKHDLAHRFSYEVHKGKIPSGLVIDHLCMNRRCVNPDHLECVTMGENTKRGTAFKALSEKYKNKTHCVNGHEYSSENTARNIHGRYCKICQREKGREWKNNNRDRVNELQQARRRKERDRLENA